MQENTVQTTFWLSLTFAYAIRPDLGVQFPGAPFMLAAALLLAAMAVAWRVTRVESG